ncbi:DUF6090 family protein [Flavobacteriaceae bacterium S356]|uniref:DUF6090 family protein n=1 Tax=Asprobacillus argus TaxID=3076534 RepID=A0ABU3LHJ4_9FLAO|nr:DUF6090 family protein [Flavobacteriaceae bacterium S356]
MIKIFRNIRKQFIKDGKTSSYLKYAIGEIALVVIGILLALQINNWNEQSKKNDLREKYLLSLIEDLKQDTTLVKSQYSFYKNDTIKLQSQIRRIKKYKNSIDTVKKIARYEFDTNIQLITTFSNKTYQTLINTGNIDLVDPWLVEELSKLDQLQKLVIDIYSLSMRSYSQILGIYNQRYPFYDDALAGDVLDVIWEQADDKHFLANYNEIVSSKQTTANNIIQMLPPMYSQTARLLKRIEASYPDLFIKKNSK